MLVLTRKTGESVLVGDEISVFLVEAGHGRAKIGFEAPVQIAVRRAEIVDVTYRESRLIHVRQNFTICPVNAPWLTLSEIGTGRSLKEALRDAIQKLDKRTRGLSVAKMYLDGEPIVLGHGMPLAGAMAPELEGFDVAAAMEGAAVR